MEEEIIIVFTNRTCNVLTFSREIITHPRHYVFIEMFPLSPDRTCSGILGSRMVKFDVAGCK